MKGTKKDLKKNLNFKDYHIFAGLKNLLVISSGAIIGGMLLKKEYSLNLLLYCFIGIFGYSLFEILEEYTKRRWEQK